jgi:hypothetical protein
MPNSNATTEGPSPPRTLRFHTDPPHTFYFFHGGQVADSDGPLVSAHPKNARSGKTGATAVLLTRLVC